eukprot:CAMPEP_0113823882 /NCGR_PEP_ID=MMETSP0328-20130328/2964_1 /TAXON_ID=39455 /ORGANISM="Alexandrium minutum" /LENGTH=162 /DNA_ID=CAMNT_0000791821 /DNA_START=24 /DNA_END=509 /DNA_ORIENTATION=- /assembly_acc=CAM_ASM_000350
MKVKVVIVGCTNLRNADVLDVSDPYCVCDILGKHKATIRTPVVQNNLNPVWNHSAEVEWDGEGDMVFKVLDKDTYTSDDVLGSAVLHGQQLAQGFNGRVPLEPASSGQRHHAGTGPSVLIDVHWRLFRGVGGTTSVDPLRGRVRSGAAAGSSGPQLEVRVIP